VLFKQRFWAGLADGSVTVAFRRWRRPSVRAGGTLQSPAGLLAIDDVHSVTEAEIGEADARQAGFESLAELLASLTTRSEGEIYRIAFHYAGADPRLALRERDDLAAGELDKIRERLARLDRASRIGPWTAAVLRTIDAQPPGTRAAELAAQVGQDTPALKLNVRKLKGLGLTESLGTGYRLSPRGRAVLASLVPEAEPLALEAEPARS
jgi:hypothetical protein